MNRALIVLYIIIMPHKFPIGSDTIDSVKEVPYQIHFFVVVAFLADGY